MHGSRWTSPTRGSPADRGLRVGHEGLLRTGPPRSSSSGQRPRRLGGGDREPGRAGHVDPGAGHRSLLGIGGPGRSRRSAASRCARRTSKGCRSSRCGRGGAARRHAHQIAAVFACTPTRPAASPATCRDARGNRCRRTSGAVRRRRRRVARRSAVRDGRVRRQCRDGRVAEGADVPPGLGFVAVDERALPSPRPTRRRASTGTGARRSDMSYRKFCGTPPLHLLMGLEAALGLIDAEGLDRCIARHARLARAVHAAVGSWGEGGALHFFTQGAAGALGVGDRGRDRAGNRSRSDAHASRASASRSRSPAASDRCRAAFSGSAISAT